MPVRSLPRDPNIEQLRNLAKTLQRLVREGEPGAVDLVREFHPRFANLAVGSPEATRFTRADMQLTLARSYGFPSWPKLSAHVETVNRLTRNPHLQPVGNPSSSEAEQIDEFPASLASPTAPTTPPVPSGPGPCWPSTPSWRRPPSTPPRPSATSPPPRPCWPSIPPRLAPRVVPTGGNPSCT